MLLVGLGNPGDKYNGTRHNIGFEIIRHIMDDYYFSSPVKKFNSLYSEGMIGPHKVRAIMPQTFMNISGTAVREAMVFFKEKRENILVIHDELDLPIGRLKIKVGGGAGGHNGLKSIDEHIGVDYKRIRFGIGHPGNKNMVSSYVLSKFEESEQPIVADLVKVISENIRAMVEGRDSLFMSRFADSAVKILPTPVEEVKP